MSIEAMKMALEALELSHPRFGAGTAIHIKAVATLRQAIEQAQEQEPVAMRYDFDGYGYKYIDSGSGSDWKTRIKGAEPLYTSRQVGSI